MWSTYMIHMRCNNPSSSPLDYTQQTLLVQITPLTLMLAAAKLCTHMSYVPQMNRDLKKSVKYCNLFINILFTQPHRKAINNNDTCKSEMMGSCGVWHIRISWWYIVAVYPSSSSYDVPSFIRRLSSLIQYEATLIPLLPARTQMRANSAIPTVI